MNYSQEWTDKISKQRQGPASIQGIYSFKTWAEIPNEEKLGNSAVD